MASKYSYKNITTVPNGGELIDIVLSRTQRKTPTQVHPQFKISRIRSFYLRKVKYCQQEFQDKLSTILKEFPKLDDIHPFYADLFNVLYDRNHYKLALGQINTIKAVIARIAQDYVRLLKYGDSPYKCKMLKRAALGRMCTGVKKLNDGLKYLEEVRQHIGRLPSIDPYGMSLILAGYPNVGKSSFINRITNANVEVQPYPFTTKSLYVGHFDYDYSRWQVIDTPGILDQPLASRNTIELTAITALAHIQAAVLFLLDISESCGFSLEQQVSLFNSIKVLFKDKPLIVVLNKADMVKLGDLPESKKALVTSLQVDCDADQSMMRLVETSCLMSSGVDVAKKTACDLLISMRARSNAFRKRLGPDIVRPSDVYVTSVKVPESRPPNIPQSVISMLHDLNAEDVQTASVVPEADVEMRESEGARPLSRENEEELGGPGVYSVDLTSQWALKNPEWVRDTIPEVFCGENIADFVDPDVERKLDELEKEELWMLENEDEIDVSEWQKLSGKLDGLHEKIQLKRACNRVRKNHSHRIMPRTSTKLRLTEARQSLSRIGFDVSKLGERNTDLRRARPKPLAGTPIVSAHHGARTAEDKLKKKLRSFSLARQKENVLPPSNALGKKHLDSVLEAKSSRSTRLSRSFASKLQQQQAIRLKERMDRKIGANRRAGEADRFIGTKRPRHLFSGKRGVGKTDRR